MTPRQLSRLAATLLLSAAPLAGAQTTQLTCAVASKQTMASADKENIAAYAREGMAMLNAEDPAEVQRGRERLATPLRCPEVSAAFRVEYGRALDTGLKSIIDSDDDFRATNALLVAGQIASNNSISTIDRAMDPAKSESIRAAAAVALQHTLREQVSGRARLTNTVIENAIESAGRRLAAESSPTVVEAMTVALRAGADRDSPLVTQTLKALGTGAAGAFAKARENPDADPLAWARVAERTSETLWRATYDSEVRDADQAQSVAAANASAQIIAYARDRAQNDDRPMTTEERDLLAKSIDSAEAALILIHSRVAGGAPVSKSMSDAFKSNPARFATEADKWIGASGRLVKAPYNFKAAELAAR